jgi:tetratricopeptide (TPR) repeat protein
MFLRNHLPAAFLICLFCIPAVQAQKTASPVDSLIELGISFYDNGNYAEAISRLEMAVKLDKKSMRARYELAQTYVAVGRFKDAISEAEKIIKANEKYQDQAYMVMGSAYDLQNDHETAIKTYRKGLKDFPKTQLLWYNLAITLLNTKAYDQAEEAARKAVALKPTHPGSNLVLGYANYYLGHTTKTVLPILHFLILENNTKRSKAALKLVRDLYHLDAKKDASPNITINVPDSNDPFSTIDLAISLSFAAKLVGKDSVKIELNDIQSMSVQNQMIFQSLADMDRKGLDETWVFYMDLFSKLQRDGHTETFTYWINNPAEDEKVNAWRKDHKEQVGKFVDWYNAYH